MGMNYCLHENTCPHCGRSDEPKHIGKSSAGWCFSLHVIPEEGINDLPDWQMRWASGIIKDEHGKTLTPEEMYLVITARSREGAWSDRWWQGYGTERVFHCHNESERGPNGLLRCKRNARCVAHGAGTWDCFVGEFS